MSINSINSAVQNQYPQISTPTANKTADAEAAAVSAKSTSTPAASDTVTISAAGQAMSSAATGFTTMLQPFDAGRALTADDKALIGYPNPSNPYVTSMAATISELREKGAIQGKMTSEYYKLDDGTQASIFDVMPQDAQSQVDMAPLKNRMMAKFAEYKNGAADEVTKLANDKFLLNLGRDAHSTNSIKAKAMMRDYSA
jgi:cell division septation protein DedD